MSISDFMENFHKNNQTMDQINRDIAKRQYEKESRQQLHENPILAIRPIIENQIRSFEASLEEKSFVGAWGGKREPQKIPPFRIVEFFGGVVRGMTTRQRLPHLSEALWRDAETPGNSATPVPGPQ